MSVTRRGASWRVQVWGEIGPDGRRKRYYRTARTKREAERLEAELLASVRSGDHVEATRETVAAYLERWLATLPVGDTTRPRYRQVLDQHILPALGHRRLASLRARDWLDLLAAWEAKGLSSTSRRQYAGILRAAIRQAARWRDLPFDPFEHVDLPRIEGYKGRILTPEQEAAYIRGLERLPVDERVAFLLLAFGGLRISEAAGLRWRDVAWEREAVVVAGQWVTELRAFGPTKGRVARTVALPTFLMGLLREHQTEDLARGVGRPGWNPHELVACGATGQPLNRGRLGRVHTRLLRELGLPHVRPHDLRHGHASILLDAGVSVREVADRLGHANPTTTLTVYAHRLPGSGKRAAEVFARLVLQPRDSGMSPAPPETPREGAESNVRDDHDAR
jgi:integrase